MFLISNSFQNLQASCMQSVSLKVLSRSSASALHTGIEDLPDGEVAAEIAHFMAALQQRDVPLDHRHLLGQSIRRHHLTDGDHSLYASICISVPRHGRKYLSYTKLADNADIARGNINIEMQAASSNSWPASRISKESMQRLWYKCHCAAVPQPFFSGPGGLV